MTIQFHSPLPVPVDRGAACPPLSLEPIKGFHAYGEETIPESAWTVAFDPSNVHWYRARVAWPLPGVLYWYHWEDSDDEVTWLTHALQVDGRAFLVRNSPARRFLTFPELQSLAQQVRSL